MNKLGLEHQVANAEAFASLEAGERAGNPAASPLLPAHPLHIQLRTARLFLVSGICVTLDVDSLVHAGGRKRWSSGQALQPGIPQAKDCVLLAKLNSFALEPLKPRFHLSRPLQQARHQRLEGRRPSSKLPELVELVLARPLVSADMTAKTRDVTSASGGGHDYHR